MDFSTLLFDLDDTLYPSSNGLWGAIRERMALYMVERLEIPADEVEKLRRRYFETYGTTLRGLQKHHRVAAEDFLEYVHDVPLKDFLVPEPEFKEMLAKLPQRKWIFTNANESHASRVLEELQLSQYFNGIVDIKAVDYACKPEPEAYKKALLLVGESNPHRCMFLDDSPRNLKPARELGIFTVLVGTSQSDPSADLSVPRLLDLPEMLPGLFNQKLSR